MNLDDKTNPAVVRLTCIRGLDWGLEHALENDEFIDKYPVNDFENNLVRPLLFACGAGLLGNWLDVLLEEYMCAVQSSAALAVNCFGPLLLAGIPFDLGSHRNLRVEAIGRATRRGFEEPDEPALYVTAAGPASAVVIDVSCLDYLNVIRPKTAGFFNADRTPQHDNQQTDLVGGLSPSAPSPMLDIATLNDRARLAGAVPPAALIYLYWEPMDASFSPLFEQHREEIATFAREVAHPLQFEAISCLALWDAWAEAEDPRLRAHVAALRARYEVPAWAWEMVEWKNGRLQSADWMMDLIEEVDGPVQGPGRHS